MTWQTVTLPAAVPAGATYTQGGLAFTAPYDLRAGDVVYLDAAGRVLCVIRTTVG